MRIVTLSRVSFSHGKQTVERLAEKVRYVRATFPALTPWRQTSRRAPPYQGFKGIGRGVHPVLFLGLALPSREISLGQQSGHPPGPFWRPAMKPGGTRQGQGVFPYPQSGTSSAVSVQGVSTPVRLSRSHRWVDH